LARIWCAFVAELDKCGRLRWETACTDGAFALEKKGARPRSYQAR